MQLRLTMLDPADPANMSFELAVEAPPDTRFGCIRPQLEALTHTSTFWAAGRPLEDTTVLGREPLVRGVTITSGGTPDISPSAGPPGVVQLSVVGGYGAGRAFRLRRGDHVIGRARSASVCLDDPDVSRAHAVITVGPDAVTVRDLEPTNRSTLDDDPVPESGAVLKPSSRLRLGSTTLSLTGAPGDPGHYRVADGRIHVQRPPRFVQQAPPIEVRFPRKPTRPDASRAPVLAALAPVVLSAGLALALSSPAMLLFALVSPVLLLGQWWSDRRAGRISHRRLMQAHLQELESARANVECTVQAQARQRRSEQPDLATVAAAVRGRTAELWQRRPGDADHLTLRIGTARQEAPISVSGADPDEPVPDIDDLPVAVDLVRAGVLGLAGQRETVLSMAGAMIAQLAAWHSPRDVHLRVLAASRCTAQDWTWVSYLSHGAAEDGGTLDVPALGERAFAEAVSQLGAQVAARQHGSAKQMHPDRTVLVLDGAGELCATPAVVELLVGGPAAGILVVCIDRHRGALPTQAAAVVELADSAARARLRTEVHTVEGITPDLPTTSWLHGFARSTAPLVDSTPRAGVAALPAVVSFRELHAGSGRDVMTGDGVIASWTANQGRPIALVGRTADGPHEIDLVRDGPHALVGGTTGAGKSELLRALVAGLAVRCRPDELTFVLVDYKGGSAFGECAALPHVLGVVTDLDEALTRRALTSLDAELRRRERLLACAGASDYAEYAGTAGGRRTRPPLARLVIVVDEFKMLADELPDFISGLVRIATVGRSLGVHLVLATQRPSGAVSADMRANIALRIALRMRDGTDSSDVIEAPDAASISDRAPGRALVRGGDGRLVALQTAHVSGAFEAADAEGDRPVSVRVVGEPRAGLVGERRTQPHPNGTELAAVVRATREAADRIGVTIPESPWLPALPDVVRADRLPSGDGWAVPLGLADDPAQQRQVVHTWDPEHGSLGLAGGPRTGRSTALVAIALRLARRYAVDNLHIHVLQGSPGPCAALARLPHTGAVVNGSDPAVVRRVVHRLASEQGGTNASRRTLVLIDGWDALEHSLSTIDHGAALEELYHLVREGARYGLRFAITGGRSVLSGRLPGLLGDRLLLHLPDPVDLTLAGLDLSVGRATRPPGRAINLRTGLEVQLALPGSTPSADSTAAAIDELVRRSSGRDRPRPWTIQPLPGSVAQTDLRVSPDLVAVGLGGDDARTVGFRPHAGERRILIAGAPRMGTSNALAIIGAQLVAVGRPVAVVARHHSPMYAWASENGCHAVLPEDAARLVELRSTVPDLCLVVDEADRLDGSPIEPVLLEYAQNLAATAAMLVAGADLSRALVAFRGLVPEVARDANGLILGAVAPTDGDLFGIRLDGTGQRRRGRGYLVTHGDAVPVQVALAGQRP